MPRFTTKANSLRAAVVVVAATVGLYAVVPADCVISVGDDASAVRAIETYGYPKSLFCLSSKAAGFATPMTPVAFYLGDGWHLLVWHDQRVQRLVHFQYVSRGEHVYGDWVHTRHVQSFSVPRPSLSFYYIALAILFGLGWATRRFRLFYRIVLGTLLVLFVLGNVAEGVFAESLAKFPILVSLGWLAAFFLGASVFRPTASPQPLPVENSTSEKNPQS